MKEQTLKTICRWTIGLPIMLLILFTALLFWLATDDSWEECWRG